MTYILDRISKMNKEWLQNVEAKACERMIACPALVEPDETLEMVREIRRCWEDIKQLEYELGDFYKNEI